MVPGELQRYTLSSTPEGVWGVRSLTDKMPDLPDDAMVLRGGTCADIGLMVDQAVAAFETLGICALSVFCGLREEGETADDVVRLVAEEAPIKNTKLRVTTAGALREAGFEFVKSGSARHYSVNIGSFEEEAVRRFVDVFEEPRRNPNELA